MSSLVRRRIEPTDLCLMPLRLISDLAPHSFAFARDTPLALSLGRAVHRGGKASAGTDGAQGSEVRGPGAALVLAQAVVTQSSPPVFPAASVVALRENPCGTGTYEIFMIRRSARSSFMPDTLVYPGGRVEVGVDGDAMNDDAYRQAAIRECREEANLEVQAAQLHWFDTWKTPSGEGTRRFLARFYWTILDEASGRAARVDGVEAVAGGWYTAASVLALWRAAKVDLPPPTLSILHLFVHEDWHTRVRAGATQLELPILPKATKLDERGHIIMPHDPLYREIPGDEATCPQRALFYPSRFVRDAERSCWLLA